LTIALSTRQGDEFAEPNSALKFCDHRWHWRGKVLDEKVQDSTEFCHETYFGFERLHEQNRACQHGKVQTRSYDKMQSHLDLPQRDQSEWSLTLAMNPP
jgi:hypothetical protein